jgi:two-component system, NarL family, response regulator LiaR
VGTKFLISLNEPRDRLSVRETRSVIEAPGSIERRHERMMSEGDSRKGAIRVLVVDDHDLFRTGLTSLLEQQSDIEVVAQASGGRMGVRLAEELAPDVVLMDLRMPDLEGAEATTAILDRRPATRVLALTFWSDDSTVNAVLAAGAWGFLDKEAPIEEVVSAVRAAAQGAVWLSSRAAKVVLGQMRARGAERGSHDGSSAALSERELEVLRLIAQGMDNAQIAASLNISPRTAKNHVSNVLSKLELPNRVQAAIFALRTGLD